MKNDAAPPLYGDLIETIGSSYFDEPCSWGNQHVVNGWILAVRASGGRVERLGSEGGADGWCFSTIGS